MKPFIAFSPASAVDIWRVASEATMLAFEAQAVVGYRIMGMAGFWAVTPHENTRMVKEKTDAFTEAGVAVTRAALSGARPDQIAGAGMKPLRQRTKSNAKRLAKRGPKLP